MGEDRFHSGLSGSDCADECGVAESARGWEDGRLLKIEGPGALVAGLTSCV